MLTRLILVIVSQFIHTSNHVVYLKIIQCYMSIISQSQKKKEKKEKENSTNQSLLPNVSTDFS